MWAENDPKSRVLTRAQFEFAQLFYRSDTASLNYWLAPLVWIRCILTLYSSDWS